MTKAASSLTVVELRKELKEMGLDTTGLKAALVARYEEALKAEGGDGAKKEKKVEKTTTTTTTRGRGKKRAAESDEESEEEKVCPALFSLLCIDCV